VDLVGNAGHGRQDRCRDQGFRPRSRDVPRISGVAPTTGEEVWSVEDGDLAGWYWTLQGLGPEVATASDPLVFVGAERNRFTRLDLPRLR